MSDYQRVAPAHPLGARASPRMPNASPRTNTPNGNSADRVDRSGLYSDYSTESRYNLAGYSSPSFGTRSNASRSTGSAGSTMAAKSSGNGKLRDVYMTVPGSQYSTSSPTASKHLLAAYPEDDDYLHEDTGKRERVNVCSGRGCINVFTLVLLALAMVMLFAGYPTIYTLKKLA